MRSHYFKPKSILKALRKKFPFAKEINIQQIMYQRDTGAAVLKISLSDRLFSSEKYVVIFNTYHGISVNTIAHGPQLSYIKEVDIDFFAREDAKIVDQQGFNYIARIEGLRPQKTVPGIIT